MQKEFTAKESQGVGNISMGMLQLNQPNTPEDAALYTKGILASAAEGTLNYFCVSSEQSKKAYPLPVARAEHITLLPGTFSFLILSSSFGPNVRKQTLQGGTLDLFTPIGRVCVEGITKVENAFLQYYVFNELGLEGLKELVALIDVYGMFATQHSQHQNVEVTLKQLLQRIGRNTHALDRDQQSHLLNTALYLSRATIVESSSGLLKTQPLLALNNVITDKRGHIWLSYHLGEETHKVIYDLQQPIFPLPTRLIMKYHSIREYAPLLLTFFLGNRLTQGVYSRYFTTLCLEGNLLSYEQLLPGEKNRTRNALRIISALLKLENDEFICLAPHQDLDLVLAANYCEATIEQQERLYSQSILRRLDRNILTLRRQPRMILKEQRREALQRLLNTEASQEERKEEFPEWSSRVTIYPGKFFPTSLYQIQGQHKT